jgi:hypothetical protein
MADIHFMQPHIPVERMLFVTTQGEARLTNEEQQHLKECRECVNLFAQVIASVTSGDGDVRKSN